MMEVDDAYMDVDCSYGDMDAVSIDVVMHVDTLLVAEINVKNHLAFDKADARSKSSRPSTPSDDQINDSNLKVPSKRRKSTHEPSIGHASATPLSTMDLDGKQRLPVPRTPTKLARYWNVTTPRKTPRKNGAMYDLREREISARKVRDAQFMQEMFTIAAKEQRERNMAKATNLSPFVVLATFQSERWYLAKTSLGLAPDAAEQSPAVVSDDKVQESVPSSSQATANNTDMSNRGKCSVGYFVNWGIYGRKFPPSLIPTQDLTHILYSFANIKTDTGEVILSDTWADQEIHYPGDSWNDEGKNLYGNFKAIYKLKKENRHLKVLLSIGGWSYSASFHPVVVNPALRSKFVASAIRLLEDNGLDGLDLDYEFPQNDEQARGYVELLRELRRALDSHAQRKGANYRFLLTIAAPCGPDNYQKLHVREMDQQLDHWNMMAYDFSGSWDPVANHQANIFGGPTSVSQCINWYISQGVARDKIIMGVPLYGRSFMNTDGPGKPFQGIGPGSWEQGVYDYRALPLPGHYMFNDPHAVASWSYDYAQKEMVSFDSEEVGRWKGEYIRNEGLGGSMFWELSGDKGSPREGMEGGHGKEAQPGRSLVAVVKETMGGLDRSPNWLSYEGSQYENMRQGMP
ncbi:hypothetical protein EUX98_g2387 [Antrodiella citrinella]|uniref:chitinase n=1 Tax=Antrodiella citrinella TaxID=2447956 RepID=A0A4S4N213_9APHY|nr:hypothetical protein EUX98_g2387 [Antrodiella citrinella]